MKKEQNLLMSMKKENKQFLGASELAIKNILVLLACVLLGIGADNRYDCKPLWTIISSLVALIYIVIMLVLIGSKKNEL